MNKLNFKSIKTYMMLCFGVLLTIVCLGLGIVSYSTSKDALSNTVKLTLSETAKQAALSMETAINNQINTIEMMAADDKIQDGNVPINDKLQILTEEVKRSGHLRMGISDLNGKVIYNNGEQANIGDREYFKKAISGATSVSDPLISKTDNSIIVVYATPIKSNNVITGVLTIIRDGNVFSSFAEKIKVGKTGNAFMLNKEGTIIAHENRDLVRKMDNNFKNVEKDPKLKGLVEIEKKMIAGEVGTGEYTYDGSSKYIAYAPLKGTGWSVGVAVYKSDVLSELNILNKYIIISSLLFLVIGMIIIFIISGVIVKPIKDAGEHLQIISNGDLTFNVSDNYLKRKDEIGGMAKAVEIMQSSVRETIRAIKNSSSNIDMQSESLAAVSQEMLASSENVSTAIQDVAKGTGEQAEDLMEITSILNDFSGQLDEMVRSIEDIDLGNNNIKCIADGSNKDMDNVINSVEKVHNSFNELISKIKNLGDNIIKISDITNLINSISEQTNLLALNAAIEAARAGEAGRGFTVVAEEVRKLAEQSKDSSQNITCIVNNISSDTDIMIKTTEIVKNELENQKKDIDIAMVSFERITKAVDEISPKIKGTSNLAESLDNRKNYILEKVEGTSSIAEEVSASSEEIASSAEEMNSSTEEVASASKLLSDMTKDMMEQVNKFKIGDQ